MTSRELIRSSRLHERRARTVPPLAIPVIAGGLLAAWVGWRAEAAGVAPSAVEDFYVSLIADEGPT